MSDTIKFATLSPDRHGNVTETNVRELHRTDMLKCPYTIMVPEHYRPDGTCRCDDPTATEMRDWGYWWDGKRWEPDPDFTEDSNIDSDAEPYLLTEKELQAWRSSDDLPRFPFPQVSDPAGYRLLNTLFCDSSGFGRPDEPALTVAQLLERLRPNKYYGITGAGQFQVYLGEYEKV